MSRAPRGRPAQTVGREYGGRGEGGKQEGRVEERGEAAILAGPGPTGPTW